ncbi:hypothetical protein GCM10011375_08910 [Hymenobacter qilianensis]|uniref:Uncharacterized protein n=2 Tax=Hymenobacter qilianensis TaxID=1385715 RepID=A0ACB5PNE4_9BACT|nr:DUF4142 domain-containing protein [Hymenobacter qilianensis]QNP53494.1 DUF4142 domain-containing protein [Hymenobacter qilianensis]GGF55976.1 hypothetical protein GCM10011375_08910 [Hymenobacter qilianensis]
MKRNLLSLLCVGMLLTTGACSNEKTAITNEPTDSEETGGNAGDNYMNAATEGNNEPAVNMPETATRATAAEAAGTAPLAYSMSDPEFLKLVYEGGNNEIQLSQLALQKEVSNEAKAFANRMIADHQKIAAEIKPLAANLQADLPTGMDPAHKAMYDELAALTGSAFEQQYWRQMLIDHRQTLKLFQGEIDMARAPKVKDFAVKNLPVIQMHATTAAKHANSASM